MSRRKNPTRPIASLLQSHEGQLQPLLERARRLQAVNTILREALGTPLGEHVTLCDVREERAVLQADSPVWLTQLRYQAPAVLHVLRQQPGLAGLRQVQFKIQPASEPPPAPPPRRAKASVEGAALLSETASHIPDQALADALRRLASSIEQKKK